MKHRPLSLGIYGSLPGIDDGRPFAGRTTDGPVLFGESGGILGA